MLQRMTDWLDRLERLSTAICGGILGLMTLLVGWQVVARYIFHFGMFWADELSLVAMMWAALLGSAGCLWTDSHVRLQLLLKALPATIRVWMLTLMDGIIVWFAVLIVKEGILLVQRTMGGQMSALPIPVGTTYYILPFAAVLMVMFTVIKAITRIVEYYTGKGGHR